MDFQFLSKNVKEKTRVNRFMIKFCYFLNLDFQLITPILVFENNSLYALPIGQGPV